jgi:hypothetical protein
MQAPSTTKAIQKAGVRVNARAGTAKVLSVMESPSDAGAKSCFANG